MSYCRWSSDSFRSDVYVYESVYNCFTCHVADNRCHNDVIARPEFDENFDGEGWAKRYMKFTDDMHDWLHDENTRREPIGLDYDGETIHTDTAGGMADVLERLSGAGYHVPDGVIEALREEDDGED